MKNYAGATILLSVLTENEGVFSDKERARLENLAVSMIKPRRHSRSLVQWVIDEIADDHKMSGRTHYKIFAIKLIRERRGLSLRDAKEWVERNIPADKMNFEREKTYDFITE